MLTLSHSRRPRTAQPGVGRVVCVDLDGTLVAGDLLWESFVELTKRSPLQALKALGALWRGKAHFKWEVARLAPIDPARLPYRETLLNDLRELHLQGACIALATAADETYAWPIARHLGIFADVIASDGRTNVSGRKKAAALVERYGHGGFTYIGKP